jgi:hypothetical protein
MREGKRSVPVFHQAISKGRRLRGAERKWKMQRREDLISGQLGMSCWPTSGIWMCEIIQRREKKYGDTKSVPLLLRIFRRDD